MPNISKEFTYNIPNEWYSDNFSEGKTGTYIYEGPEYLTIEIDKETGRESGWCLYSPEEHERPVALDIVRITVDCDENPLLCEIINDQGKDSDREFYASRQWKILYKAPEGYVDVEVPVEFHPRDIYDESKVKYDFSKDEFILPVKSYKTQSYIDPDKVTWDHFRIIRNQILSSADGEIDDGMPEEHRQLWLDYKQLLRDAPEKLAEFHPFFAELMLPPPPDGDVLSVSQEELLAEINVRD